jgi:hypothetical protein
MSEDIANLLREKITGILMDAAEKAGEEFNKELTEDEISEFAFYHLSSKPTAEGVELVLGDILLTYIKSGFKFLQLYYEKARDIYGLVKQFDEIADEAKPEYAQTQISLIEGGAMNEIEEAIFGHPGGCAYDIFTQIDISPQELLRQIEQRKEKKDKYDIYSVRLRVDEFETFQKYFNLLFAVQVSHMEDSDPIEMLNSKRVTAAVNGIAKMLDDPALYDRTKERIESKKEQSSKPSSS